MKYCPQCQHRYSPDRRYCPQDGVFLSLKDPYNLVGNTLSEKYRLDALAGVGGMGAVYCAHQVGPERRVAVKILLPNLAVSNKHSLESFQREAKTAAQFLHENVAIVFDAGRSSDIAYIAMEWLDGLTLADELSANGPLSFERAGEILRQVAAGLEAAHTMNVIHRDLKPSNIMLIKRQGGQERVKILDFGIGKMLTDTEGSKVSVAMGTPHYASPEQLRAGDIIDHRTDVYSLGVVLYEMLTGLLPFNAPSMYELMRQQEATLPLALCKMRPEAPVAVEHLITRMLAYDVSQRPQTAVDVALLYERALRLPDEIPSDTQEARAVHPLGAASQAQKARLRRALEKETTIYKYPIPGRAIIEESFSLDLPQGAQVLDVQVQRGSPCIWAMVNPWNETVPRRFLLNGTGFPLDSPGELAYVGTFQMEDGTLVYHLFEDQIH